MCASWPQACITPWVLRLVLDLVLFQDRQRVHVRAQEDGASLPGLRAPNQSGHARLRDPGAHILNAEGPQSLGDDARGPLFLEGQLGMDVKITPVGDHTRQDLVDVVPQSRCHSHFRALLLLDRFRRRTIPEPTPPGIGDDPPIAVLASFGEPRRERHAMSDSANPGESPTPLIEAEATRLAGQAVDLAGGARMIYRNPRQPFSPNSRQDFDVEGHIIEVRWGEISSPAIVTAGGYVFEILEEGIELLARPPKPRG